MTDDVSGGIFGKRTAGEGVFGAGAFAQEALRAFDFLTRGSLDQLEQIYAVLQGIGSVGTGAGFGADDPQQGWREQLQRAVDGVVGGAGARVPDFTSGPLRFGVMRDLQQLMADLGDAMQEHLAVQAEFQRTLGDLNERTWRSLQARIETRLAAGESVASLRALYDLWVDSGEESFGATAHGDAYIQLQARVLNSVIKVRRRQQALLEYFLAQWNLPSRAEFDALQAQVNELRRARK